MRTKEEQKTLLREVLDRFTEVMYSRLCEKVDAGKEGFDDPKALPQIRDDLLSDAYNQKVDLTSNKMHDLANRAMFLWWQDKQKEKVKEAERESKGSRKRKVT